MNLTKFLTKKYACHYATETNRSNKEKEKENYLKEIKKKKKIKKKKENCIGNSSLTNSWNDRKKIQISDVVFKLQCLSTTISFKGSVNFLAPLVDVCNVLGTIEGLEK